jgi:glycoside/pentoside/hexuronide:cation symporter, GPH family
MENTVSLAPRKSITKGGILTLCLGDVARGMIYGLITTYLLTFFVPTTTDLSNNMALFLVDAGVAMAIIRSVGMLFDGITDPLVANLSDRYKGKNGRRIPFMRWSAIPYGLFCALIFFPPVNGQSVTNAIWVGAMMILYYSASTLYQIPFSALQAEITQEPKKRSFLYMTSAMIYVIASAMVYLTSTIKGVLVASGIDVVWAFRIPFLIFIAIGTVCAVIPAFAIKENDYVVPKQCGYSLLKSVKETFKYKNFTIMVIGFLVMWIAFGFFNASMIYYIEVLLGLPEMWGTIIPGICIVVTLICYPLVTIITRKIGKRIPLCVAMGIYALLYLGIYLCGTLNVAAAPDAVRIVIGIFIGILDGIPLAATNIIPPSAIADCAQYDTILTGEKKEGMFMAAKNFCMKVTQSAVLLVAPLLVTVGGSLDSANSLGVSLTALVAGIAAAASILIYAFYDDKEIKKTIEEDALKKAAVGIDKGNH